MANSHIFDNYLEQLNNLRVMIEETNEKSIAEDSDAYFNQNINFFTKSFHISLCAYLESFLKDITFQHINKIDEKLKNIQIPHNLINWSLNGKKAIKNTDIKFTSLSLDINREDLDNNISGNPYKTIKFFINLGIDLENNHNFQDKKDRIHAIVSKRNDILHHNDDASDVTFSDIVNNIDTVIDYMRILDNTLNISFSEE